MPLSASEKKEVVSSGSTELLKFFKKLVRRDDRNSRCIDCDKAIDMEMERGWGMWGSVNNGCFFCMNCSGRHRSIGVHLSFVRSTVQDDWKREQLQSMQMGGNGALLDFWNDNGIDCKLAITEKYALLPSIAYRMVLKAKADEREPVPSTDAALAAAEWMIGPGKWDNKAALELAIEQTKASAPPKPKAEPKPKPKPKVNIPKVNIPKVNIPTKRINQKDLHSMAEAEALASFRKKYPERKKATGSTGSANPLAQNKKRSSPRTIAGSSPRISFSPRNSSSPRIIAKNPLAEPVTASGTPLGVPICATNPLADPVPSHRSAGLTELRMGGSLNFSALNTSKSGRKRTDTVDSIDALCAEASKDGRDRGESTISMGSLDGLCNEEEGYGSPRERHSSLDSLDNMAACGSMGGPMLAPDSNRSGMTRTDSVDSMDALCAEADISIAGSAADSMTSRDRGDSSCFSTPGRDRTGSVDSIDRLLMETPRAHQAYLASHRSDSSDDGPCFNRNRGDSIASMNSIDFLCADADNSLSPSECCSPDIGGNTGRSDYSEDSEDSEHARDRQDSIDSMDELCAEADEWKSPSESMPHDQSMDDLSADAFGEGIEPLNAIEPSPEICLYSVGSPPASSLDQF